MHFELINPKVGGSFETIYDASSAKAAAKKMWQGLTKYITGEVPNFGFTMKDADDNFHHFIVSENRKGPNVKYTFKIVKDVPEGMVKDFMSNYEKKAGALAGGKHKKKEKDDSSSSSTSSSDSDSDEFITKIIKKSQKKYPDPLLYWWYYPYLYTSAVDTVFIPSFIPSPTIPYIEVALPNFKFYSYQ